MSSDMSMPSPRSMCGPEQFEHAAGAGAEIEQRADRTIASAGLDRALDRASATCRRRMRSHSAACWLK
jgi:hypothetical protein